MKTIYSILALACLLLGTACIDDASQNNSEIYNPIDQIVIDTPDYDMNGIIEEDVYNYEQHNTVANSNWNLNYPARQMRLYAQFEMNDLQQERYETALTEWMESGINNSYDKLSTEERKAADAALLKPILDEDQFQRYEAWASGRGL